MEDTSLSIVGPGTATILKRLQDIQALLGLTDIGDALDFSTTITLQVVTEAVSGKQLASYDKSQDEVHLFNHQYLDMLVELSNETAAETPEDPLPD